MSAGGAQSNTGARRAARAVALTVVSLLIGAAEVSVTLRRLPVGEHGALRAFGLFALVAGFCLLLGAVLTLVARGLAFLGNGGTQLPRAAAGALARLAAWLLVAPLAAALGRMLFTGATRALHNQELAALGATLAVLVLGAVSLRTAQQLAASIDLLSRERPRLRWFLPLPGALLTLGFLGFAYRSARLEQIDPALWLTAAAALAAWFVTLALVRRRPALPSRALGFAPAAAGVLLLLAGALAAPYGSALLAARGGWSRPTLAVLRLVTDFDGDGHSGWFGGGDCAALDAAVHPGAAELPGDGVDNNCVGGDSSKTSAFVAPRPNGFIPPGRGGRPNLVVVSIETLRADHTSLLGYARKTTPELDALAASSVVFEASYATTPTTRLSLTALFSGVMPSKVRWLSQEHGRQMRRIAPETPWLPELLRRRGYTTLAVLTDFRAFTAAENAGFDRGFTHYDTSTKLRYSGGTMRGFPGGAQVDRALALLDDGTRAPFFLWLHLMEPHYVYERSENVQDFGSDEQALYDADIREADRQLGRLLRGLSQRGVLENSVLLVTGDHGEEFGEHGERWHGSNLYEPQLRTVTLLRAPSLPPRRLRVPTSLLDVAPTLLDLLGVTQGFEKLMGRNLTPLVLHGRAPATPVFLENFRVDNGAHALHAMVTGAEKCIFDADRQAFELYDVVQDPAERTNRFVPGEPRSEHCRNRLFSYLESPAP